MPQQGAAGKWAQTGSIMIPSQTIAAGPEMVKTLCLFFHFNYLFQFNYWLIWESEKVTPDLVGFRDFHTFSLYLLPNTFYVLRVILFCGIVHACF